MEGKVLVRYTKRSVEQQMKNIGFYVILFVTFCLVQFICYGVGDYLWQTGDKMNVFEIYIWSMTSSSTQLMYLLGVLFCVYGCEIFHKGASFFLIRMNRKTWLLSQVFHIVAVVVIYNVFFIISYTIACRGAITFRNSWSQATRIAGQTWVESIGIRGIMSVNSKMLLIGPTGAAALVLLMSVLIGTFVGILLLIFMLLRKPIIGIVTICLIWFMEFF